MPYSVILYIYNEHMSSPMYMHPFLCTLKTESLHYFQHVQECIFYLMMFITITTNYIMVSLLPLASQVSYYLETCTLC